MSYKVQFIGLHYFSPNLNGQRRALLPDGRFPDPGIQPHVASISVRTEDLVSTEGWHDHEVTTDNVETEFLFGPSRIDLPFPGKARYEESAAFGSAPRLKELAPDFEVGDDANWIANIPIPSGSFEAYRVPGLPDPSVAPLLAELTVDHEEEIVITVTARKGWPQRQIVLNPGSEIAIINTSRGLAPRNQGGDHFQIYAELSSAPVKLKAPERDDSKVPFSRSMHPMFKRPRPATYSSDCVFSIGPP